MPTGTSIVLDARTLDLSNSNLLLVLKDGQKVLDIGCGSGPITMGISKAVGRRGSVLGLDSSQELIDAASCKFSDIENLEFKCLDILDYHTDEKYDVITSARTLQWIAEPWKVIEKVCSLLSGDGVLCILDYNHTKIQWDPSPPQSMLYFYNQFLLWRSDSGMDNEIGDHIQDLLKSLNMEVTLFSDYSEYSERGMAGFEKHIDIWNQVARLRGEQLVMEGWISEEERLLAIEEYATWSLHAKSMKLYLRATHAIKINPGQD